MQNKWVRHLDGYSTFWSGRFGQVEALAVSVKLFRSRDISVWLFRLWGRMWGHFSREISVHKQLLIFVYLNDYIGRRNVKLAGVMTSCNSKGWPGWAMAPRLTVGSWIMLVVFLNKTFRWFRYVCIKKLTWKSYVDADQLLDLGSCL